MTGTSSDRVSRREYIAALAERAEISVELATKLYAVGIEVLLEQVASGRTVLMTGLGRFYVQRHKGHLVQFTGGEKRVIPDYPVLKFSAAREVNQSLPLPVPADEVVEPEVTS